MTNPPGPRLSPPVLSMATEIVAGGNKRQRLEIPIFGATCVELAVSIGTGRLELNAAGSYVAGGTTPSLDELRSLRAAIDDTVPVRVMIRPRGPPQTQEPDFIYSTLESYDMRHTILKFKQSGLLRADRGDGFVFGALRKAEQAMTSQEESHLGNTPRPNVEIDIVLNTELVDLAKPFKAVFHRAFDDVLGEASALTGTQKVEVDRKALEIVKSCGFDGILTSGGPGNAPNNADRLAGIVRMASRRRVDERLEIIVGGGVRSGNISALMARLAVGDDDADESEGKSDIWFHSSCLSTRNRMLDFDGGEVRGLVAELAQVDM